MNLKKDRIIKENSFFNEKVYFDKTRELIFTHIEKNKDLTPFYQDKYYKSFYRHNFFKKSFNLIFEKLNILDNQYVSDISKIKEFSPSIKSKKILEIGCGQGKLVKNFHMKNINISAIELDKKNVKEINSVLKKKVVKNINIENEKIEEKYDIIILRHVLEHFKNPVKVLKKIKKNLSQDGIIYINVPYCENKKVLHESIMNHPHIFHFSKKSLRNLIEESDLKIIYLNCFGLITRNIFKLFFYRLFNKNNYINRGKKSEHLVAIIKNE